MENASKALIMAAGILIAIIIITVLTITTRSIRSFQRTNLSEEEIAQIKEYNDQYIKYLGDYMYGTEIITMINKHNDYLGKNMTAYPLAIKIIFLEDGYGYNEIRRYRDGTTKTTTIHVDELTLDDDAISVFETSSSLESFRNRAYKCTKIEYEASTGRVNYIEFQEIKWK